MRTKPKPNSKSHYETLEVDKQASPDTIKKAYRAKSRKSHPDKGGSDEAQAELNEAYETLIDPSRRLLYDTTGESKRPPIEEDVRGLLLEAFAAAIAANAGNCLYWVKTKLSERKRELEGKIKEFEREVERLEKKRDMITVKDGEDNLFWMVIDGQVNSHKGNIEQMKHGVEVITRAVEKLKGYRSSEVELITQTTTRRVSFSDLFSSNSTDYYK